MAGQSIERRDTLRMFAVAGAASAFPGFSKWAYAFSPLTQIRSEAYKPLFFNPLEYETVMRLTEIIIPSDGTPGAREAGVSEFIDFMAASDPAIQYRFRSGLAWLQAYSQSQHRQPFTKLTAAQQVALLEPLGYRDRFREGQEDGRVFFRLLRDYTVMGFYTTRTGYQELDSPALRMYSDSPACPHTDDPEHRRLKA